ncbi:alpha/beta hydrolase [Niallia sp. 03190]|uniref:alpha/beta hydrolase n=1 Tax=Niallia sp. 03190 TaxID=3458061 RepID=UPI004043EF12
MRIFEILLLSLNVLTLVILLWKRGKAKKLLVALSGVALILLVLQFAVEHFRWQIVPAYVLTFLLLLWSAMQLRSHTYRLRHRALKVTAAIFGALYVVITVGLPVLLPVFETAKPSGPYAIGTATYHWIDVKREEKLTKDPVDKRQLMVQIWYPAETSGDEKIAPYIPDLSGLKMAVQQKYGVPGFFLDYLRNVNTHASIKAKISNAQQNYPLLLFAHGFPGTRYTNTSQVEELVSHGYIVACIDYTYHSIETVFPDGKLVLLSDNLPEMNDWDSWDQIVTDTWVPDSKFVLDQIEQLNTKDPNGILKGKINLKSVGMFGHSFGGAAAAQTLLADPRFKAGMNMDGTLFGKGDLKDGLKQPFLMMNVKTPEVNSADEPNEEELLRIGMTREDYDFIAKEIPMRKNNLLKNGGYSVMIDKIDHLSFTDLYLLSPFFSWNHQMPPRQAHSIINDYTLAFFDKHLKGKTDTLFDRPSSPYPEVKVIFQE